MSQVFAETLTDAEREQVTSMTDYMYSAALKILQDASTAAAEILADANQLRATVGLPLPEGVVDLNAYRVPRQVVHR